MSGTYKFACLSINSPLVRFRTIGENPGRCVCRWIVHGPWLGFAEPHEVEALFGLIGREWFVLLISPSPARGR